MSDALEEMVGHEGTLLSLIWLGVLATDDLTMSLPQLLLRVRDVVGRP